MFFSIERIKKSCSPAVGEERSGFFEFWHRFGSVTGFFKPAPSPKADDRHHSPKLKNPRSAWPQFFFKRSSQIVTQKTSTFYK
jgi:hypothetical protein